MYEARQNKEEVSRRIDGGNMTRQRMTEKKRERQIDKFLVSSVNVSQLMIDRIKNKENRYPTEEEIEHCRESAIKNSEKLTNHGREEHGKRKTIPKNTKTKQEADSIEKAINKTIQM